MEGFYNRSFASVKVSNSIYERRVSGKGELLLPRYTIYALHTRLTGVLRPLNSLGSVSGVG